METKEVVLLAKKYVMELFAGENVSDVGLEGVSYDDKEDIWNVTIGFSRPWDKNVHAKNSFFNTPEAGRSYKVVRISNINGHVLSVDRDKSG